MQIREDTLDSRLSARRKLAVAKPAAADVTFRSRLRGFDRDEVRAYISNLAGDYERAQRDLEAVKQELDSVRREVSETPGLPEATSRDLEQILAGGARIASELRGAAEQERQSLITGARSQAAGIIKSARRQATQIVERAAAVTKAAEEEHQSITAAAHSRAGELIKDAERRAGEILEHAAGVSQASDKTREQAENDGHSIIAAAQSRGEHIVEDAERRAHEIVEHAAGEVTRLAKQTEVLRAELSQIRTTFEVAADAATSVIGMVAELEPESEHGGRPLLEQAAGTTVSSCSHHLQGSGLQAFEPESQVPEVSQRS